MSQDASVTARALRQLQTLATAAIDLVLPPRCVACATPIVGGGFCWPCSEALLPVAAPCARCALPGAAAGGPCEACAGSPPPFDSATAKLLYGGPLADAIVALKFRERPQSARPLGALLRPSVEALRERVDLALPVPLHRTRLRERGYNQAALLARQATRGIVPLRFDALARTRSTRPQSELPRALRIAGPRGAFTANARHVATRRVLLIDDVMTTGATAAACARALARAGARTIHVLTLARAVP